MRLTFTIASSYSLPPVPSIIALNPNSAVAGSAGLLVDLSKRGLAKQF